MNKPKGWHAHYDHQVPRHVWPQNDMAEHVVNGLHCWCQPRTVGSLVIHNSLDGRETREIQDG